MWPTQQGPVLCLVTDRRRLSPSAADETAPLLDLIGAAVEAGIDLVQIREGDLDARTQARLVTQAVAIAGRSQTRIVVNERFDIGLAAGAHGVHLKGRSASVDRVRPHLPAGWIVGRSIHGIGEGRHVTSRPGLDYLVLGTVFSSRSKPGHPPLGLEMVREAASALPLPVLAIGGISADKLADLAKTGAAGLAAIGLFADLANSAPQEFRRSVDKIRKRWGM